MSQQVSTHTPKQVVLSQQIVGNTNGVTAQFDTSGFLAMELMYAAQFTGGTAPAIAFSYQTVDPFGNTSTLSTTTVTGNGVQTQALGLSAQANKIVGMLGQVSYVITGAPSSVTFSLYIIGVQ